jgi:hypothetical protein
MIEQNGHPQTSDQILRGGLNNSYHFVLYSNRQTPDLEISHLGHTVEPRYLKIRYIEIKHLVRS